MRSANQKIFSEELAQRVAELAAQVSELTRRLKLIEGYRGNGSRAQQTDLTTHFSEDDYNPIEFHTENGFIVVRPNEGQQGHYLDNNKCRFRVQDDRGIEREVTVEVSARLLTETAVRSRNRIEASSQFWVCCAERRLANYLMEHDDCPADIHIDELSREDLLLSIRWGKSG